MSHLFRRLGRRFGRQIFSNIRRIGNEIRDISSRIRQAHKMISGIPGAEEVVNELFENVPLHNEIRAIYKTVERFGPSLAKVKTPKFLLESRRKSPVEASSVPLSSESIGNIAPRDNVSSDNMPSSRRLTPYQSNISPSAIIARTGGRIPQGGIAF